MISVGIDVSKEKSTVCILRAQGEILCSPYEITHTVNELDQLSSTIQHFDEECRVVMEATGIYHLPVACHLKSKGIFVSVVNPFEMKTFAKEHRGLRGGKTDRQDAVTIANYGIERWFRLKELQLSEDTYSALKLMGRQYYHYMRMHVESLQELTHLLDYTMPGIKNMFKSWNEANGKDKLGDFSERYWHYEIITQMSEEEFVSDYNAWAKEKGYHQSQSKAKQVYAMAKEGIPTLATTSSVKMLVAEAVRVLKEIDNTLSRIISQMREVAKTLPEYSAVRAMGGVGDVLAPKLIAEIGDVRRFHNGSALVAYAGIDVPPFESGQFKASERSITKRGSKLLRKIAYEVMCSLTSHDEPTDNSVYQFIRKKEQEGKIKKQAKIAGINKFLRIYYARVLEVYTNTGLKT